MTPFADGPLVEPVEVLRVTAASPLEVSATIAGGIAAVATLGLTVVAVGPRARDRRATLAVLWLSAVVATGVELALGLTDAATGGAGIGLGERRGLVVLARLMVLAVAAAVVAAARRDPPGIDAAAWRGVLVPVAVLAVLSVPLGMPRAGTLAGLLEASALTAGLAAGLVVLIALSRRCRAPGALAALVVVLGAGSLVGVLLAPEREPAYHAERVVTADVAFDLTVAPARTGRNEIHVYAWDLEGQPIALDQVDAMATSGATTTYSDMFAVSPNHHLSYELELPDTGPWELTLSASRPDAEALTVRTVLEAP